MNNKQSRPNLAALPVELQLQICEYALCHRNGAVITYDNNQQRPRAIFAVSGVGLLRACRAIYLIAQEILYSKNTFILNMHCTDAYGFLLDLPARSRERIKYVRLTPFVSLMITQNQDYTAQGLVDFMTREMNLRDVAVAVPHDLIAGQSDGENYRWWMWEVQFRLVQAFSAGHFDSIRLVHPRHYAEYFGVYAYQNVLMYVQDALLGRDRHYMILECLALRLREVYNELQHLTYSQIRWWCDYLANLMVGRAWREAGFEIVRARSRAGEAGTVLVIRRINPEGD